MKEALSRRITRDADRECEESYPYISFHYATVREWADDAATLEAEVNRYKDALDDAVGQVADGNFMRGLLPDTDKDVLAEIMASAKEGEKK